MLLWRREGAASDRIRAVSTPQQDFEDYLARRHRPAHGRRTAARWSAHLLSHLRPEMRVLDIGCGPGSITTGLVGRAIGVDPDPVAVAGVPVAGADGAALPFGPDVFDAIHLNAVLQHVADADAVLREALRVATPGAVIGVGDADWGGQLLHPADPLIDRGRAIQQVLRSSGDVHVGRRLRGLLAAAGFERVEVSVTGRAVGTAEAIAGMAEFERGWFEAPEVVAYVTDRSVSDPNEMASVASAWTRWAADPGAFVATLWFMALGWVPSG
jgi:SAM-dependent methyltransferase